MFSKEVYVQRRKLLKEKIGKGILLFLGNEESCMNFVSNNYRFRQDASFLYFFGINRPSLSAIIDIEKDEEIIFGNEFSLDDKIWLGPQPSLTELASQVGVPKVSTPNTLTDKLNTKNIVHFLPQYRPENRIRISELLKISIHEVSINVSMVLIKAVIDLRSIKSDEEIEQLSISANITGEMHQLAMQNTVAGKKEFEIVAELYRFVALKNAAFAYPIIFTENGQILHNFCQENSLKEDRLVLLDAGAENKMGYAADITRSFPVSKHFNSQQKEIYQLVLDMQSLAISMLKPHISYKEVHLMANRLMLEGFAGMGLVKGNIDVMLQEGVQGLFMQHGIGHHIGLDVHDMESLGEEHIGYSDQIIRSEQLGLKSLRLATDLKEGFAITVEPGIYFIPELIQKFRKEGRFLDFVNYDKLAMFENFGGIRIEDMYSITNQGANLVGKPIAKTISEIESLKL